MQLVFKRRLTNELLTTYLPTILLLGITYCTTFFKPFFFEAALTVNLAVMLVMTTLFISVMGKLPSTSYVRMVDIWLIYGQLVPFIEVIILTVKEKYRDDVAIINHHGMARQVPRQPIHATVLEADSLPPFAKHPKGPKQLNVAPPTDPQAENPSDPHTVTPIEVEGTVAVGEAEKATPAAIILVLGKFSV